jgi:predicted transcriptional regulator of viral defense system
MIKTTAILYEELKEYANPAAKIQRLVDSGKFIPVVRGLYETDKNIPGYYLASSIYGPSYLSFEFALAYHSLIPEAVYNFTCATFEKKKAKQYTTPYGEFTYRDVPSKAYPHGTVLYNMDGYSFIIATPEKALCDKLYTISPCGNKNELEQWLFDDMRINRDEFSRLNMTELYEIAACYNTQNHRLLRSYTKRSITNE